MNWFERLYRRIIHRLIVNYLNKCGGAFHHGSYGKEGNYVKLYSNDEYSEYQKMLIKYRGWLLSEINNNK